MTKQFNIPIKITNTGVVAVMAETEDEAYRLADDKIYWAYQSGMIESNKDVSITEVEVNIDGEELDLDEFRDDPLL